MSRDPEHRIPIAQVNDAGRAITAIIKDEEALLDSICTKWPVIGCKYTIWLLIGPKCNSLSFWLVSHIFLTQSRTRRIRISRESRGAVHHRAGNIYLSIWTKETIYINTCFLNDAIGALDTTKYILGI